MKPRGPVSASASHSWTLLLLTLYLSFWHLFSNTLLNIFFYISNLSKCRVTLNTNDTWRFVCGVEIGAGLQSKAIPLLSHCPPLNFCSPVTHSLPQLLLCNLSLPRPWNTCIPIPTSSAGKPRDATLFLQALQRLEGGKLFSCLCAGWKVKFLNI